MVARWTESANHHVQVSEPYHSLISDFHRHRLVDPNRCVQLGVEERLDELPDPSLAASSAQVQSAQGLLERIRDVDRSAFDFDQTLDLELVEDLLEQEIHNGTYLFNGRTTLQQLPSAGDDIADGIFMMFVNDPRPAGDRLQNITKRLEMVPDYLQALLRRLHRPVRRWVEIDRKKVSGLPDLFGSLEAWAIETAFSDVERLRKARASAEAALEDYDAQLALQEASDNIHVGESTARRIVELRGIDLSLEALHRIAREFLADNRRVIEDLRRRLALRYGLGSEASVREVQRHLNAAFAVQGEGGDLDGVLRRYEEERDRVCRFLENRNLFPIPENQAIKILRTPKFLEPTIPAGAMVPPPAFREGLRTSLVYLTLSNALLDEHTELSIPGMMIHEGIPGHHLQLASASLHPSVVRRHVDAMEQAEGWTTMLEDYMLDLGYLGTLTDEARFIGKLDIARIGARVGIDLYFMTGEKSYLELGVSGVDLDGSDPFALSGRLLCEVTGFSPERTHAELNWYSIERGYPLCYLAGNHLVWKLKADVAQAGLAGPSLDRSFHEVYLGAGNMPLKYLRRVYQNQGLL